MSAFADFNAATVTVETRTGSGGMGDTWATPVSVEDVQVDDARRLVRGADAAQTISETTVFDDDSTRADIYTTGSKVLLPSGRTSTVIVCKVLDALDADLPAHLEVSLT
jgi:hypothetical protein